MSQRTSAAQSTAQDEQALVDLFNHCRGMKLPTKSAMERMGLGWMPKAGITPSARIVSAERVGTTGGKPDVIVRLDVGEAIRITKKRPNADFAENWITGSNFVTRYGEDAYQNAVTAATEFANAYRPQNDDPFVGVAVSIGRRSGQTGIAFDEICKSAESKLGVLRGFGEGDAVANCLYLGEGAEVDLMATLRRLHPLSLDTWTTYFGNMKLIYRVVYPRTNISNLSKCSYTEFTPYQTPRQPLCVTSHQQLQQLGTFTRVSIPTPDSKPRTHNAILRDLKKKNIIVPTKQRLLHV